MPDVLKEINEELRNSIQQSKNRLSKIRGEITENNPQGKNFIQLIDRALTEEHLTLNL
jgi:hypothetical protein